MRTAKKFLNLMAAMAVCLSASAAEEPLQTPLKGRILDQDRNPLPGAVVHIDGNHQLTVSYIGFSAGQLTFSMIDKDGNILHQIKRIKKQ